MRENHELAKSDARPHNSSMQFLRSLLSATSHQAKLANVY